MIEKPAKNKTFGPVALWLCLLIVLILLPTGYENALSYKNADRVDALVLSLIYGWDRRCLAATSGAALGILVTAVLGYFFTDLFQIHGAVMESSESLL